MSYIWHTFLYDPLFNALIVLYNGPALQNLGVALIELTVLIRIVLLPLTLLSIQARSRYDKLQERVREIEESYKNDRVRRKEEIRAMLKVNHINPWAKAAVLGFQFIILIVLYRVFVDAVRDNDLTGLYDWNWAPDFLDRDFLGFDLVARSPIWSGFVGVLIYMDLWLAQRKHPEKITKTDLTYRVSFPLFSFLILYLLPSGKSIFVLTSLLFSLIINGIRKIFVRPPKLT